MKISACLVLAFSTWTASAYSVAPAKNADSCALGRRQALVSIIGASVAVLAAPAVNALDMDSFANAQVSTDVSMVLVERRTSVRFSVFSLLFATLAGE